MGDTRETTTVAGSGNSQYAEQAAKPPGDSSGKEEPRQEGSATIRNSPDLEAQDTTPNTSADHP